MGQTVVLISGSTRAGSTSTAALAAMHAEPPAGVTTVLYDGLVELPAFVPGDDPPPAVIALLDQLAAADAVLLCTPEYAGELPGAFKNLLDWTVGGGELYAKRVAWLTVAPEGRGEGAVASLRRVLGYVGADVVEEACVRVPVGREALDHMGNVVDPVLRERLGAVLARLVPAGQARASG